jgi:hypothetical protein
MDRLNSQGNIHGTLNFFPDQPERNQMYQSQRVGPEYAVEFFSRSSQFFPPPEKLKQMFTFKFCKKSSFE